MIRNVFGKKIKTRFFLFFVDPTLPSPITEPKSKKRKAETDSQTLLPYITVEKPELKNIHSNFMICMNCWDLLNSSESLRRGMLKYYMYFFIFFLIIIFESQKFCIVCRICQVEHTFESGSIAVWIFNRLQNL